MRSNAGTQHYGIHLVRHVGVSDDDAAISLPARGSSPPCNTPESRHGEGGSSLLRDQHCWGGSLDGSTPPVSSAGKRRRAFSFFLHGVSANGEGAHERLRQRCVARCLCVALPGVFL